MSPKRVGHALEHQCRAGNVEVRLDARATAWTLRAPSRRLRRLHVPAAVDVFVAGIKLWMWDQRRNIYRCCSMHVHPCGHIIDGIGIAFAVCGILARHNRAVPIEFLMKQTDGDSCTLFPTTTIHPLVRGRQPTQAR